MAERIAIVGLGLIGTSLGLALKKARLPNVEIWGHDRDHQTATRALRRGAVDRIHINLIATVEKARLVVLATPVMAIQGVLEVIGPHLQKGTVVTDTASTKGVVLEWARRHLPEGVDFVGGHPLAGAGRSGPDAAEAGLFQGVTYCIVPSPGASEASVQTVVGLAETVGARPYFIDAAEHDSYVAAVSDLPTLLSIALVACTSSSPGWREISRMASANFRQASLLASSDPQVSRDACLANPTGIAHWLDQVIRQLYEIRQMVLEASRKGDGQALERAFAQAWEARARWEAGVVEEERRPHIPTASEGFLSFFLGERLARQVRQLQGRERDQGPRYDSRR